MAEPNYAYEAVIGLEVHAQLKTNSKLFSGDDASFEIKPNSHVGAITLGHPGTLPVMNKTAMELAIKMGLVCGSEIALHNYFARKNYFYPDLPKGYQISQHTTPICRGGFIPIETAEGKRSISLTRIHLEEDAGKSLHDQNDQFTLLDYNRAGVALIEIVSEPEIHSAEEAAAYLTTIRKWVRWLDICDGNMEEGSLRCDANISVRPKGETKLGTRVEVKNLNSIKHLKQAIEIEIKRLTGLCVEGKSVLQETRGFDADQGITYSIRVKEDAEDYRYFPEPDLAPFHFNSVEIRQIKEALPLMPEQKRKTYQEIHELSEYDANQLTEDKSLSDLFDRVVASTSFPKQLGNLLLGPVRSYVNETGIDWSELSLPIDTWIELIQMIQEEKISFSVAAAKLLPLLLSNPGKSAMKLAKEMDWIQDADESMIQQWVNQIVSSMPDKVAEYQKGKKGLLGLFVGEVKRISKGKADPQKVNAILIKQLQK